MKRPIPIRHILCALCLLSAFLLLPCSAAAAAQGQAGEQSSAGSDGYSLPENLNPDQVLGLPDVTVDDLGDRLNEKGADVVFLIQTVARYICIGAFVISCILILVGLIGNRRTLASAILGAVLSGVCYGAITCGEQIVQAVSSWFVR